MTCLACMSIVFWCDFSNWRLLWVVEMKRSHPFRRRTPPQVAKLVRCASIETEKAWAATIIIRPLEMINDSSSGGERKMGVRKLDRIYVHVS